MKRKRRQRRRRRWLDKLNRGTRTETRGGKSKGEKARRRRRKRVRAEVGERDAKGAERRVKERRLSAEGCGFRFGARSAFLNLCPRMPLVMPIRDAFEPR